MPDVHVPVPPGELKPLPDGTYPPDLPDPDWKAKLRAGAARDAKNTNICELPDGTIVVTHYDLGPDQTPPNWDAIVDVPGQPVCKPNGVALMGKVQVSK